MQLRYVQETRRIKITNQMTTEIKLEWVAFAALFPLSVILGRISSRLMKQSSHFPRVPKAKTLLLKYKN